MADENLSSKNVTTALPSTPTPPLASTSTAPMSTSVAAATTTTTSPSCTTSSAAETFQKLQQSHKTRPVTLTKRTSFLSSSSNYPLWHTAMAGAVAGAGSRLITAPLDLLRIRRQLTPLTQYPRPTLWQQLVEIVQTEEGGLLALYRGNWAAVHLWVGYSAVQFALYDQSKRYLSAQLQEKYNLYSPTLVAFGAGAFAGLSATIATYPFDVCRTTFAARGALVAQENQQMIQQQQQQQQSVSPGGRRNHVPFSSLLEPGYDTKAATPVAPKASASIPKTMTQFTLQLYRQKGIPGFYSGATPAVIQIIPYMGLNFAIYDFLSRDERGVAWSGYAGTISGSVSKLLVYPMDTIKRRLQAQAFSTSSSSNLDRVYYTSTIDCAKRIWAEEGLLSFYQGAFLSILKSTIATGMTFAFFRMTKNVLENMHDRYYYSDQEYEQDFLHNSMGNSAR